MADESEDVEKTIEAEIQEDGDADDAAEMEEMKRRVQEMEEEAEKLKELQESVTKEIHASAGAATAAAVGGNLDENSVFVGQVDYEAQPEELREHFDSCGTIERITIAENSKTGRRKGYAYIEFADKESVESALLLNDSIFKGRQLKVMAKRVNVPGLRGGRGRGGKGGRFHRGGKGGRFSRGRGWRRGGYRGGYHPHPYY